MWCTWAFLGYLCSYKCLCPRCSTSKLQNFIEMTLNMIYIVAFGGGLKCPRKIHLNTQCRGGDQKVWKCAYIIYEWPQRKMDEDRHIMMRCFESRNDTPTYDQKNKIDVHRRLKSNTEYRQQSKLKQNMRLPAAVCSLKSKPEKLIT